MLARNITLSTVLIHLWNNVSTRTSPASCHSCSTYPSLLEEREAFTSTGWVASPQKTPKPSRVPKKETVVSCLLFSRLSPWLAFFCGSAFANGKGANLSPIQSYKAVTNNNKVFRKNWEKNIHSSAEVYNKRQDRLFQSYISCDVVKELYFFFYNFNSAT